MLNDADNQDGFKASEPLEPPRKTKKKTLFLGCTAFDCMVAILIVFFCAFLADWRRQNPGQSLWFYFDQTNQIGAEYDTIAQSIRDGRGFSDPFHERTGPTAWMPPVLVYFTAGLYWITGDNREYVVEIILLCNMLSILFGSLMVVGFARKAGMPRIGLLTVFFGLLADFSELFLRTHDTWLILLLVNLTWLGLQRFRDVANSGDGRPFLWGCFGGLAALSGPVVGFAWAASTTIQWFFQGVVVTSLRSAEGLPVRLRRVIKPLSICALGSILIVTPWMVRNRIMMEKWIPVKSNAMYEIWQSQVLDDDGVLDSISAFQHPWGNNGDQRKRYVEVGELAFIEERAEPTWTSIRSNPMGFLGRVANRFFAATIYYQPLVASDESHVWANRITRCYFPLPLFALFIVLWLRPIPLDSPQLATISLYVFALGPYILISYYARYAAPLAMIKMLLILHAVDTIWRFYLQPLRHKTKISSPVPARA